MTAARILIVEDEAIVARHVEISLKKMGYGVVGPAHSGEEALTLAEQTPPDLALMDVRLKGEMDGIQTGAELRNRSGIPIIFLTAYADQEIMERAITTDPFGYLLKPYDERSLQAAIEMALRKHRLEQELRQYARRLEETHQFDRAILAADTPEQIANETLQRLGNLLPVERASFMFYLPDRKGFQVQVLPVDSQTPLGASQFVPEEMMASDVLAGSVILIEDLAAQSDLSRGLEQILRDGYRSSLTVPLMYEGQLQGLLNLASRQPGIFHKEMVDIATDAASQAAVAIRQALLYQSERRALAAAEILRDASLALSQSLDLELIVNNLFFYLDRLVAAQQACVWLRTPAGILRRCSDSPAFEHGTLSAGENDQMQALFAKPAGWLVPDLSKQERPLPGLLQGDQGSWMGLPLLARGNEVGALALYQPVAEFFQPEQLDLVLALGANAAIALSNAELYAQVQAGQQRLRQLGQQVITAQEGERLRISRELHDEAGQALTALKIGLGLVDAEMEDASPALRRRMAEAIELAGSTLEQIRLLAQDLRPPALDTLGLSATLDETCRSFSKRSGVNVTRLIEELPPLSDLTRITFYRMLQEGLTNIARHSQASEVEVRLWAGDNHVSLWIRDNGRGFNVPRLEAAAAGGTGIGLIGMRERVELAGGWLQVDSDPQRGTTLLAEIPLGESA